MGMRNFAIEDTGGRESLKLSTAEFTIEENNLRDEPIIHLFCRRDDGSRRHIEVEGFYPSFYISGEEFIEKKEALVNDGRIRWMEVPEEILEEADDRDLYFQECVNEVEDQEKHVETLHDEKMVKIFAGTPNDVSNRKDGGMSDYFDRHWEADVFFTQRFLIDTGIKTGLTAPKGEDRIHYDELNSLDTKETPDILPRTVYLDIEVWSEDGVPSTTETPHPITSISAYDNYDDEYKAWILHSEEWANTVPGGYGGSAEDFETMENHFEEQYAERWPGTEVRVFADEANMLDDFHEYIKIRRPDILTGWNAHKNDIGNGFDFPYLINRSKEVNAWNIKDWSPIRDGGVYVTRAGTARVDGIELFDMLRAYEKTQIHELDQKSLEFVAKKELGMGKETIGDLNEAWMHNPVEFLKYNIRDSEAVLQIDHAQDSVPDDEDRDPRHGVIKMYDHLRDVTGQLYGECHHNISMIDMLFLRDAYEKNLALPTSTKPDVRHYHGAKVFDPTPGRSKNVFYPDLASLYPNLFWATNMSPETVIGNYEDLQASSYEEDDCFMVYWDPREEEIKKDDDAPDYVAEEHDEALYVIKPDIKKGFVRDSIGDLIDMKMEYKGTNKYGAVKRVTNSVYGVIGDSDTYGRGFRLFDVRIAEAITLAGRKVIEFTAKKIRNWLQDNGFPEAKIVAGDTDSAMCAVPGYDIDPEDIWADFVRHQNGEEVQTPIFKSAKYANESYDAFMAENFNIVKADGYAHKMEVEVECVADALFFKSDYDADDPEEIGKKKRYSQTVIVDEDDGIIENPEAEHTGWELIRSDTSAVTKWAQDRVLTMILMSDTPKEDVFDFMEEVIELLKNGDLEALGEMMGRELTIEDVGIPKSIASAPPETYGVDDETGENTRTPHPHIRGAKYATQNIEGENIEQGAKPYLFPIEPGKTGSLPPTYTADTLEDGNLVDAVAVEDVENLTSDLRINWDEMVRKLLKRPINEIIMTMGWQWTDVTSEGRQSGLGAFA